MLTNDVGKPVDLPPESEEVAGFFAAMLDTDHAQNDVFRKNFFDDWKEVLKEFPPVRNLAHIVSPLIMSTSATVS